MIENRRQRTEDRKKAEKKSLFRSMFSVLCLLSSVVCLPSCGFQPVYGTHSGSDTQVVEQLNQIAIDNIPDRKGQILRNELIDRMYGKGRPAQPLYHLMVKLRVNEEDLGIQANATSSRSLLNMYGDYSLQDMKGKEILHGMAHSISSFNTLVDEYGNLSAYNGAVERTVEEVGEQIVNRLSLYFAEKDEGYTPPKATAPIQPPDQSPSPSSSFLTPAR
jgi:LPS-assembly lipoprotein